MKIYSYKNTRMSAPLFVTGKSRAEKLARSLSSHENFIVELREHELPADLTGLDLLVAVAQHEFPTRVLAAFRKNRMIKGWGQ